MIERELDVFKMIKQKREVKTIVDFLIQQKQKILLKYQRSQYIRINETSTEDENLYYNQFVITNRDTLRDKILKQLKTRSILADLRGHPLKEMDLLMLESIFKNEVDMNQSIVLEEIKNKEEASVSTNINNDRIQI